MLKLFQAFVFGEEYLRVYKRQFNGSQTTYSCGYYPALLRDDVLEYLETKKTERINTLSDYQNDPLRRDDQLKAQIRVIEEIIEEISKESG